MIAKLRGILDSVGDGFLILDVNGVGYRVFCSAKTQMKMPANGQSAALLIETQVREDHIHLFGFADAAEKGWIFFADNRAGRRGKGCFGDFIRFKR